MFFLLLLLLFTLTACTLELETVERQGTVAASERPCVVLPYITDCDRR